MYKKNGMNRFLSLLLFMSFCASAEPIIIESSPIHFGEIQYDFGASCDLSVQGNLTGVCEDTNGSVALAEILITNLTKNERILITLNGSSNGILSFVPSGEIRNAKGGTKTILDGQSIEVRASASGADINLTIYGQLEAISGSSQSGPLTVSYTIDAVTL